MNDHSFDRVSRDYPCPICGRPDWCLVRDDESAAICPRVSEGAVRRVGEAGWLHILSDRVDWQPFAVRRIVIPTVGPRSARKDLAELAMSYRKAVGQGRFARLATDLGVSSESLARLGIGWCETSRAWSFPMVDASRNILGIRLRTETGRKFAVKGGNDGLFLPDGLDGAAPLLIAEGPTDTAALLDLDFVAVGRPNCRGGRAIIADLIHRWRPSSVVIIADNDPGKQGMDGAQDLARRLSVVHRDVRIVTPPPYVKDARVWVRSGATRLDMLCLIEAAAPIRVAVCLRSPDAARAGEDSHGG
jgi:hypothetical protein